MLAKIKNDIDRNLSKFLKDLKREYGLSSVTPLLFAGMEEFVLRPGKRIRPILFIVGYLGYTKKRRVPYHEVLNSSLSLELLHDFMLIHDDIIDASDLRRGKPTLHRLYNTRLKLKSDNNIGPSLAMVAGDALFSLAVKTLFSIKETPERKEGALQKFIEAAISTCSGEFLDIVGGIKDLDKITNKDVFNIYTLKTAKYTFECPMLIGAILAGAPKKELIKLSELGISLGQAFQIQDDMLDIFSSSKKIGKPILSDLDESKKTLLLWKAYKDLAAKDKKELKNLIDKKKKTHNDLLEVRKLIKKSGGDKYCQKKIKSLLDASDKIIAGLSINKKYRKVFDEILESFFSRTKALDSLL